MRVTDKMKFDIYKSNLGLLKESIDKTQNMIASGKKIMTPSDDPVAASTGVKFQAEKSLNDQYKKNLEYLKTLGSFYDTSVNTIHELLSNAKQIAVTQASDTMNASTRSSASEAVKGIMEQLVTVGNTKVGSNYIFGGKKSNAAPFSMDDNYNVTFNGSSEVSSVYVDGNTKEDAGISGASIFMSGTNIFQVLKDFKDALDQNDTAQIQAAVNNISDGLDKTETNLAHVGAYAAGIDNMAADNASKDTNISTVLSEMTDADITQVVTDFNSLTNAYQAMLYSMAKIQDLTVLNYLK